MIKNVHLAFFINEYDKEPIWTDLKVFKDAIELDRFMDYYYNNSKAIKKEYEEDISEFSIDKIDQYQLVEDKTGKRFYGRLSAYYYGQDGKMEFLELPTKKKILVRDYRMIPDLESAFKYLTNVFDDAVKRIKDKYKKTPYGPPKKEFIHYVCEKLRQCSYEVSNNELYYLVKYYNHANASNRKGCLTLIKTNLKRYYSEDAEYKENLRLERESPPKEEQLTYFDDASMVLQQDVELTKKNDDYDYIFLNHDLDELDKYTNLIKKGK